MFDITGAVTLDSAAQNIIAVKVDNSPNEDIPPSPAADFNFYGGIYRDVWLVATEPVHFKLLDFASTSVYAETTRVSATSAQVRVRGTVTNDSSQPRTLRVVQRLVNATGQPLAQVEAKLSVAAGAEAEFQQNSPPLSEPHLWSPETPYLYELQTQVFDEEGISDQVTTPLGFRWFSSIPRAVSSSTANPTSCEVSTVIRTILVWEMPCLTSSR